MELLESEKMHEEDNLLDLLNCLKKYIRQYGAPGRPFQILDELSSLSIERVEKGEDLRISSTSLLAAVDGYVATDKSPGSSLAGPWRKLTEEALIEREPGLAEYFSQQGFTHYLWPTKAKSSGGAGNPSMYSFELRDISGVSSSESIDARDDAGVIRYIPELTPQPAWMFRRLLASGYSLEGWRRWLLIGFGLILILIVGTVLLLTILMLAYASNLTLQAGASWIITVALIVWISYSLISPLSQLLNWRIICAPDLLVSFKEQNVLLELVSTGPKSEGAPNVIRLVRYAGTCPICLSRVEICEGKKEFPNRFVGRCNESPAEHVFSFDRMLLKGKLLR